MESLQVSEEFWLEKRKAYEAWRDKNSGRYDGSPLYRRLLSEAGIEPWSLLLDVGCKDGKLKECLPPNVTYVGLDPFPFNVGERKDIFVGRAESIPFEASRFDVVTCFASIFHFQNLERAFQEMARVLRRSGMLVVLTVIRKPTDSLSESHTFRIGFETMDRLAAVAGLRQLSATEVPEIKSWLYRYSK